MYRKLVFLGMVSLVLFVAAANSQDSEPQKAASSKKGPPFASWYCPVYYIMDLSPGYLYQADAYEEVCTDIPVEDYYVFLAHPQFPVLCPCEPCVSAKKKAVTGEGPGHPPLQRKVPSDSLPLGLNPNLHIAHSPIRKFKDGEEEVFVRVFTLVHIDRENPSNSRRLTLGWECETPKDSDSVKELSGVEKDPRKSHIYRHKQGEKYVLLVRVQSSK
jgi:hypothetical protein